MKERISGSMMLCGLAVMLTTATESGSVCGAETSKQGGEELKYEEPKYLAGAIYAPSSHKLLFKFKRQASRAGSRLEVQRVFTYPAGEPAARERAAYEGNNLVFYELEELQTGARDSATIQRDLGNQTKGSIGFEYARQTGSPAKRAAEVLE